MRLLLDTHVLVWWLRDDSKLAATVRATISADENEVMVSSVSVWELATKQRVGKWLGVEELIADFEAEMGRKGLAIVGLNVAHARLAGLMPGPHRDPFDRMLVAQSMFEEATLVTSDGKLAAFNGAILWAGGSH